VIGQQEAGDQIGYLVSAKHVVCLHCAGYKVWQATGQKRPSHWAPLYVVNVSPYSQACHDCGAVLVAPRTPAWPELFVSQGCRGCELFDEARESSAVQMALNRIGATPRSAWRNTRKGA